MKIVIMVMLASFFFNSCCIENDYMKSFGKYERAVSVLTENKSNFLKFHKRINKSEKDDFVFMVSKEEFVAMTAQEGNRDFEFILALWKDNLINDDISSLWFLKNGNIYFQLNKCRHGYNYLVYDGGEEIEIDVSDDNIKERIKPNWLYIRMR